MFLFLILVVLLIFLAYKWGTSSFDHFEKRGIPYEKPIFFAGNSENFFTRKQALPDLVRARYEKFKSEK
jgi:cytochrome P450 family 9